MPGAVSSGESKDLLDKINGFLLNQNSLSGFVEAAKAYSNEFSYAKIAERTVMLYREVLAQESAA